MAEEISHAEEEVRKAKGELEKGKERLKEAIREKEKIEIHKERWTKSARKEEERLQDLEMEEFKAKGLDLEEDFEDQ